MIQTTELNSVDVLEGCECEGTGYCRRRRLFVSRGTITLKLGNDRPFFFRGRDDLTLKMQFPILSKLLFKSDQKVECRPSCFSIICIFGLSLSLGRKLRKAASVVLRDLSEVHVSIRRYIQRTENAMWYSGLHRRYPAVDLYYNAHMNG